MLPFVLFPSMGEYPVYDDAVYDGLAAPDARSRAYDAALRAAAPGRVVLDVGTGRDALWAVAAARAGARHVYAIEAAPAAAAAARAAVDLSGFSRQITVLEGWASHQVLPVRAEVCVSEIVGNIASSEGAIPILNDCRQRLCTPGCVWIPFRARTMIAAVDVGAPSLDPSCRSLMDRVIAAAGGASGLRLCLGGPAWSALVSSPAVVESDVFDSRILPPISDMSVEVELVAGKATGLLLWTRVAVASSGREVDTLDGGTRAWAPVYLPAPLAGRVRVGFSRRTSDDGVHPDYQLTVDGVTVWRSPHHVSSSSRTP
ncbi:50S ribosomal protein L11 methyltransferase [Actinoplanes sp. NPDC048796]|uniref:50S ribosomal protein L11 methyltransferase n=1 Tax=Actinoplanes sp. NPDC048796 TaxID=3155640 RepID=UPI0033DF3433